MLIVVLITRKYYELSQILKNVLHPRVPKFMEKEFLSSFRFFFAVEKYFLIIIITKAFLLALRKRQKTI